MRADASEVTARADEGSALTPDNTLLSRPTIEASAPQQAMIASPLARPRTDLSFASNCTNSGTVADYVEAGIAPATRRAYRTDLDHFKAWGGTLPATDAQVADYLADHATVLKVSTLTRRLAAISVAHKAMLSRYVREGELFLGNAAGILL